MSYADDLRQQAQAVELAREAVAWLRRHDSVAAMEQSDEPILCWDYGTRAPMIWYTQRLEGDRVKFGHAVMREGEPRHAEAAACDLHTEDGVHWVLCGVSNASPDRTTTLAPHVQMDNMVHEATHYLDFMRSGHKPRSFQVGDTARLRRLYYNKPHEMNAFFQQGLFLFVSDLFMVKDTLRRFAPADVAGRRRHLLRLLYTDRYWRIGFAHGLSRRNRRRFIRRAFRAFGELLPAEMSWAGMPEVVEDAA